VIDVLHADHAERAQVIECIKQTFRRVYAAEPNTFMPHFIRVRDQQCNYKAIIGYRDAEHQRLFLEAYLDEPIETVISHHVGEQVERASIVEVGNLAEAEAGDARLAIIAATAFLHTAGYRWVVFTGVSRLRNAFRRLGLEPKELVEADDSRLSEAERKAWGTYYSDRPVVCYGDIRAAHGSLLELWVSLRDTWASAAKEGDEFAKNRGRH
jgi:hypothetical protein